jgi:glycosyltransferase involved in cell wall biosynthesis
LSILVAHAGHEVTLLNCSNDSLDPDSLWRHLYRRYGIEVVQQPIDGMTISPWEMRCTMAAYRYLQSQKFDIVIFQDWLGLAYASAVSKRAGLAMTGTMLVVNTHGSVQWVQEIAEAPPSYSGALRQMYIERRAVELADAVISPSRYMLKWMKSCDWKLPTKSVVIQNYLDGLRLAGLVQVRARSKTAHERHIAFFGRLERRKGLFLFLEALRTPPLSNIAFELSFLGRECDMNSAEITDWLNRHRPDLVSKVRFFPNKTADEAREYLRNTRALAAIPSISDNLPCVIWECIEDAIPFVSTVNGGIPELISEEAHEQVLVEPTPTALADRLAFRLDESSPLQLKHREAPEDVGQAWLSWLHREAPRSDTTTTTRQSRKRITVLLLDRGDRDQLALRLQELSLQSDIFFDLTIASSRPEPQGMTLVARTLKARWIQGADLRLKRVLQPFNTNASVLIVCDSLASLSPGMIEELRRGAEVFPEAMVTAHHVQKQSQKDTNAESFLHYDIPRVAPPGGHVAAGIYENVFGEFPIAISANALKADWLPEAVESAWGLLAAWSLAGGAVEVLPTALSCRETDNKDSSNRVRNEFDETRRIYMTMLPSHLKYLAALRP